MMHAIIIYGIGGIFTYNVIAPIFDGINGYLFNPARFVQFGLLWPIPLGAFTYAGIHEIIYRITNKPE